MNKPNRNLVQLQCPKCYTYDGWANAEIITPTAIGTCSACGHTDQAVHFVALVTYGPVAEQRERDTRQLAGLKAMATYAH